MFFMAAFTLLLSSHLAVVLAQTPVGGQIFTNGLSIINAPALNAEFNVGGNIPISVEVSGNGKLPLSASTPGSGLDTAFEELDIFLVSSQTNINITVSAGPDLLTNETGTVRHLNFLIPSCVPSGQYNMTFYERSTLAKKLLYVITPIPISIRNSAASGDRCTENTNTLQSQPQPDATAPQSPFLSGNFITVTITNTGETLPTAPPSDSSVTTVTLVVESPVITTGPGQTTPFTSVATFTTTAAMRSQDLPGFTPVNSSIKACGSRHSLFAYTLIVVASFVLV